MGPGVRRMMEPGHRPRASRPGIAILRHRTFAACLVALSALSPLAHAGGPPLVFPTDPAGLTEDEAAEVAFMTALGCRTTGLTASEQARVRRAARHAEQALAAPEVRRILREKADWVVEAGEDWIVGEGAGAELLERWAGDDEAPVSVLAFERAPGYPCEGAFGDGSMHALNREGSRVILFHRGFLERQTHAPDPEAGTHVLARTLAHELTHVLGFTHHDDAGLAGSAAYNNTVPAFVGCAVLGYPDVAWVAESCEAAHERRVASRWETRAVTPRGVPGDVVPGARVAVRVVSRWVDATVRAVDPENGRVEVDYGVAEVPPAWVGGFRLRVDGAR